VKYLDIRLCTTNNHFFFTFSGEFLEFHFAVVALISLHQTHTTTTYLTTSSNHHSFLARSSPLFLRTTDDRVSPPVSTITSSAPYGFSPGKFYLSVLRSHKHRVQIYFHIFFFALTSESESESESFHGCKLRTTSTSSWNGMAGIPVY
jgi:hypothetical protein